MSYIKNNCSCFYAECYTSLNQGGGMIEQSQKLVSTKSNKLVDAGFFKKLNGMEMRIVNLAISRLNPMRPLDQSRRFEFTVKEFLDCNSGIANYADIYDTVRSAVINLGRTWVEVETIEGYDRTEISLLTERSYSKGKGRFMVEFHEKAMPYLAEIKSNYTSILLDTFGALKSEYSLKLYEILSRWAFKGVMSIKVDELKNLLDVVGMYDRYNNFRQRVLTPAINEINSKTDLNITVKTLRTGRSITDIEFVIFDKSKAVKIEQKPAKRPVFPHKNKYGRYVTLDRQNPKMSSTDYGNYARDCLKILDNFYTELTAISLEDLRNYWVFLAVNASHQSKLGKRTDFIAELKKRGYRLVDCELVEM